MNNEQFVTIIQSALFSFIDGLNLKEILELTPDYQPELILQGIRLAEYLKDIEIKQEPSQ